MDGQNVECSKIFNQPCGNFHCQCPSIYSIPPPSNESVCFCCQSKCESFDQTQLPLQPPFNFNLQWSANGGHSFVQQGSSYNTSRRTDRTSHPPFPSSFFPYFELPSADERTRCFCFLVGMENSQPLGRRLNPYAPEFYPYLPFPNYNTFRQYPENYENESLRPENIGSDRRFPLNELSNCYITKNSPQRKTNHMDNSEAINCNVSNNRDQLHSTLNQTRSPEFSYPSFIPINPSSAPIVSQTSNNATNSRINPPIFEWGPVELSTTITNTRANDSPLTLTRKKKKANLAETPDDFLIPLKVKPVDIINLQHIRSRLNEGFLDRWDYLFNLLEEFSETNFLATSPHTYSHSSLLSSDDADKLVSNHIIRKISFCDPPAEGYAIPFTVKEKSGEDQERRFILWTKTFNEWLKPRYTLHLNLDFIGLYLNSVLGQGAALRDLATSFFQIPLPPSISRKLRFFDMTGNQYEIMRLPMGLSLSVEIMQIVCLCIGGDHAVVRENFFHPPGFLDVWVDNLRFIGDEHNVKLWNEQVDSAASFCNVTFKPSATHSFSRDYTFIGVNFDHESKRVLPSPTILNKLSPVSSIIPFRDLEQLVGRLIFCASVTRIPLVRFYFSLKWIRRIFNRANRGDLDIESTITIPPSIVHSLNTFIKAVSSPLYISSPPRIHITLFTDASKDGWGAVLVDDINKIRVIGSRWKTNDKVKHINELEGEAVFKALSTFDLREHFGKQINIYVDNTSIQSSLTKGNTHSDSLAPVVHKCTSFLRYFSKVKVGYIGSKDNPADYASRNFAPREFDTCALGGRAEHLISTGVNTSDVRY